MTAYNWPRIMEMKSDSELREIIETNLENFESEAILAAKSEIIKRKNLETHINEPDSFPEKPSIDDKQQSILKSGISLVVFITVFYVVFKMDFKFILIIAGVLLIHELGHFIAMRVFKYKDLSIFFIPLVGAYASGTKDEISQKQKIIISLAGPLPGVIIGTILIIIGLNTGNNMIVQIGNIFIYLNLFNLLPIIPLDGGQIIKNLFFQKSEKINIAFIWISISVLTLISLNTGSYFLLVIPFFLLMQLKNQALIKKLRLSVQQKGIDIDRGYGDISNKEYWLIRDEIALNVPSFSRLIEPGNYVPAYAENRVITMVKQILHKHPKSDMKFMGKLLVFSIWVLTFIIPLLVLAYFYISLGIIKR